MKRKATPTGSRTTTRSSAASGAVEVPLSLRSEIERELDGWREFAGDDDNCIIKGDLPYSSDPARGVERMLQGLADVGVPGAAIRRFQAVRPELVALLKKTSLDDLDGEVLLDWLTKAADLRFVDDLCSLPSEAKAELAGVLADVVNAAVTEDVSVPAFAERVVQRLGAWANAHSVDAKRLARYEEHLNNGGFNGVVWYRAPDARAALVEQLVEDAVKLFKVRWIRAPSPVRPYSPEGRFSVGDRLTHPKFGAGEVMHRLDGKIEIRFESGVRTLAAKTDDR
jgi:hypothetical protein